MSLFQASYNVKDRAGQKQEVTLCIEDYKAAFDQGLTFSQYVNQKVETDSEAFGTPYEQCMASARMFVNVDHKMGLKPPTLAQILDGSNRKSMGGAIVAPDGVDALDPAQRLLFFSVILELANFSLIRDDNGYNSVFQRMLARTLSLGSDLYQQPIINTSGPRDVRMQPVGQGALPPNMISISLSKTAYTIPTFSIALEVTDQARQRATLDFVADALREQSLGWRAKMINESLVDMINGNSDLGMAALPTTAITTYDPAATTGISHLGWISFLMNTWVLKNYDWVIGSIPTALRVEGRSGRPTVTNDEGTDTRLNSIPVMSGIKLRSTINWFPAMDEAGVSIIDPDTIVAIDSSKAIQRVVYAGATYSAVEEFVMRRVQQMRFDISEMYTRYFDNGWGVMTYTP